MNRGWVLGRRVDPVFHLRGGEREVGQRRSSKIQGKGNLATIAGTSEGKSGTPEEKTKRGKGGKRR